jgi:hypothetical protein
MRRPIRAGMGRLWWSLGREKLLFFWDFEMFFTIFTKEIILLIYETYTSFGCIREIL